MDDTTERNPETFGFRPLYQQVRDSLIERLKNGEWRPGEALGSETQLAQELGVSQGTVRKAINELAERRLVVRRQGRGTFVAEHTRETDVYHYFKLVDSQGRPGEPDSRLLNISAGTADEEEAAHLNISAGTPVVRLHRVRTLEGVPAINERISLPDALFPGLADLDHVPNVLYQYFQGHFEVTVVKVVETVTPVLADDADFDLIGAPTGSPLLRIDRVALTFDDAPVEWRVSRCVAGAFKYRVEHV